MDYGIVAESFETSVPWDKCEKLCYNVKAVVAAECKKHGIQYYIISCRVTQTYDAGACVYFYFGFRNLAHSDPVHTYEEIENKARDEILASGEIAGNLKISELMNVFLKRRIHLPSSWSRKSEVSMVQTERFYSRRQSLQVSKART